MNKVLLISTNELEAGALANILEQLSIMSQTVQDWDMVFNLWETDPADLMVVLSLPINTNPLPKNLREWVMVPIIFVDDRRCTEQEQINLLTHGVVQIVQRPFNLNMMALQIRALLNHTTLNNNRPVPKQRQGELRLDRVGRCLYQDGEIIQLSRLEFRLFELLYNHQGVISLEQIVNSLWVSHTVGDYLMVRKIVYRLRKKLAPLPHISRRITSIPGVGYIFYNSD